MKSFAIYFRHFVRQPAAPLQRRQLSSLSHMSYATGHSFTQLQFMSITKVDYTFRFGWIFVWRFSFPIFPRSSCLHDLSVTFSFYCSSLYHVHRTNFVFNSHVHLPTLSLNFYWNLSFYHVLSKYRWFLVFSMFGSNPCCFVFLLGWYRVLTIRRNMQNMVT